MSTNRSDEPAALVSDITAALSVIGIVVMALSPFAIPGLLLAVLLLAPLVLPVVALAIAAGFVVGPVLAIRRIRRRSSASAGHVPRSLGVIPVRPAKRVM
jgi:hypothetical protein